MAETASAAHPASDAPGPRHETQPAGAANTGGPSLSTLADHRRASRRRGRALERAIFEATFAELNEVGYLHLSLEHVAQRASTGNASVYRRWPSRAELVLNAIRHLAPEREKLPDTGSTRGDLLALLRSMAARQAGPAGEVMRGVIAESLGNERVDALRASLADGRNQQVLQIFRRGVFRGEVRPGSLDLTIASVGPTMLTSHFLLHGAPVPDHVVTDIVDKVVMALISPR